MTLWIDADAAPGTMMEVVFRAVKRLALPAVMVANRSLWVPPGHPTVTTVCVDGGLDVADRYIAEHARPGDVAITADVPLAAALVPLRVHVLDQRGDVFDDDSIGERLSMRNAMDVLRGAGTITGGPRPYGPRERQAFASALDRTLTRAMADAAAGRVPGPPPS